ncbi:MAG: hypothetical protein HY331_06620 [Chloroflexi bacterium]|nr:hypothetical protein [Chloroflexota bacterium]
MDWPGSWIVIGVVALILLIWAGFLVWGWRSGQFVEETKYQVFDDD